MSHRPDAYRSLLLLAAVAASAGLSAARGQQATAPAADAMANSSPIERANADAVARLYAQIGGEPIDATTVGQVVDAVGGRAGMIEGLHHAQQIGGPREVAPGLVQVKLEISGARAAQLVLQAVAARPDRSPIAPQRLAVLLQPWGARTFGCTGDSGDPTTGGSAPRVPSPDGPAPASAPAVLPAQAPAWADEPQTVGEAALSAGAPLRTARAAEAAARRALRLRLAALALDDRRTLGSVAADHPELNEALDRAVEAARISGVDYRADGSVEVRVSIDGRQVWQSLQLAR